MPPPNHQTGSPDDQELAAALSGSLTVDEERLRLPQRIHAVAIVVLPLLGAAAAVALATRVPIRPLDVGLLVVMYVITILGISVGFHRLFTHRSFKANLPVRVMLGIWGSMAGQGSLSYWVSNHRRHHQHADKHGDLHSPYVDEDRRLGKVEGFWHSHMGWTFDHKFSNPLRFARDLYRDPALARVNQLYLLWVFLGVSIPAALGGLLTRSWMGALTGFLWGGPVRLVLTYHSTNAIDSVNHIFGRKPYHTGDEARNNVWIVLPTLGEGWHNNHHALPTSALFGFRWWQIDPGGMLIRLLESAGWVWDVNRPTPVEIQSRQVRAT